MPPRTTSPWWCPPPHRRPSRRATRATFVELDSLTAPQVQQRRHWRLGRSVRRAPAPREAAARSGPAVVNQVHLGPAGGHHVGRRRPGRIAKVVGRQRLCHPAGGIGRAGALRARRLVVRGDAADEHGPDRRRAQSGADDLSRRRTWSIRCGCRSRPRARSRSPIFTLSDHRQQRTDADAAAGQTSPQVQFAGNVAADGARSAATRIDRQTTAGI